MLHEADPTAVPDAPFADHVTTIGGLPPLVVPLKLMLDEPVGEAGGTAASVSAGVGAGAGVGLGLGLGLGLGEVPLFALCGVYML